MGFDAAAVSAAALADGLSPRRVRAFARVALPAGALVASPTGPCLVRADEVRAALRRAVEGLGSGRATLVLPDGVARVALLDRPPGAEPADYVRFRLAASLPWPASEAIFDALPAGRGRMVGAAVRRSSVAEFEQAGAAAGLEVDRVHLAPLLALEGLMRSGPRAAVHVVLGDSALCLASFRDGLPAVLRSRRRDPSPGEAFRLRDEAARAAAGDAPPLVFSGSGARRLAAEIGDGRARTGLGGPSEWPEAAEAAWLGGLLS